MKGRKETMGNQNSGRRVKPLTKRPDAGRVVIGKNKVILYGISDAARWLGCTPSALSAVCRGVPNRGQRLLNRAKKEFPQLFPAA